MAIVSFSSLILPALLIELFLSVTWKGAYFSWGLPIYSRRIPVAEGFAWQLPISTLRDGVTRPPWPTIAFSAISDVRCAFRESFFSGFNLLRVPYAPVMRGSIVLDHARKEIRIVGFCNWYVLLALSVIFGPAMIKDAQVIPMVVVLFGGSYLVQRARFNHVADVVSNAVRNV